VLFIWLKELFFPGFLFDSFFLRLSISVFKSSFIFCVTFNSHVSFFIVPFVSLGVC
jgi:hypothetical protein